MKAVILAGGFGSRISEETHLRPKPMLEVGGRPILWHVMKIYSTHGIHDFVICLGYKGYIIKEYFANYFLHNSDVTIDVASNQMEIHHCATEPWRISLIDTGDGSQTGGRLKRVSQYVGSEDFCFTYGDGVGDVDVGKLVTFHKAEQRLVTVTAVEPPGRYGALLLSGARVEAFAEKPKGGDSWINGGFFVVSPKAIDYIAGDHIAWEAEPLERLAHEGQLSAYKHHGFWHAMDTQRDKNHLEDLWRSGKAPWKTWS